MKREWLIFAAQAFGYFVIVKLIDWVAAGAINDTFGPEHGVWVHAAFFGAALLAFAIWGLARLRDRFAVLVALVAIAIPLATWACGTFAN